MARLTAEEYDELYETAGAKWQQLFPSYDQQDFPATFFSFENYWSESGDRRPDSFYLNFFSQSIERERIGQGSRSSSSGTRGRKPGEYENLPPEKVWKYASQLAAKCVEQGRLLSGAMLSEFNFGKINLTSQLYIVSSAASLLGAVARAGVLIGNHLMKDELNESQSHGYLLPFTDLKWISENLSGSDIQDLCLSSASWIACLSKKVVSGKQKSIPPVYHRLPEHLTPCLEYKE